MEKAGQNKKEAERRLAERVNQLHRGEYVDLKNIGFEAFTELWLTQYAEGAVKRSTLDAYRSVIKNHLVEHFGDYELRHITAEEVQQFVTTKRKAGLSPKTVSNHVVILKEMFKHAVRWGYLRSSPAEHVERPRSSHREMDFLNPQEVRAFLQASRESYPERYSLFLTAVMTGMRRGELLAMKWQNVDWNRGQYFVKESLYRQSFQEPKSERSRRSINLSPTVLDVLEAGFDSQAATGLHADPAYQDLIFCHEDGRSLNPDHLSKKELHRVLEAAGLRRIRFHDFRHTYVALLISQGESPKYIQSQLGHASIQVTLDRYGHLMPEVNEQAAARLEMQIFGPSIRKPLEKTA